jgi:imidazolonepropionase-like amidohydrolase
VTTTLVTGIGELTTMDPGHPEAEDELGTIHDAALVLGADEHVLWVGRAGVPEADRRVDIDGRAVIPAFVDSHTHLVFAGDRSAEFAARIAHTPAGSTSFANRTARTRSSRTKLEPSCSPAETQDSGCGSTGTSSAPDPASGSPSSLAPRALTTART